MGADKKVAADGDGFRDVNAAGTVDSARLLGLLGLALRAGKLQMGMSAVEQAVHRGKLPLVILAADMGPSQRTRALRLEPVRGFVTKAVTGADLATALGRNKLSIVSVCDPGFVDGIRKLG
ncbi:MAG: ribosomal L7Ae/L30e/S12e/Gadd45 family protein [bacterium]|nr:ribosomal L7Ae/L30e/S12e/Gadd45 family protein [bacterium]